MRLQRRSTTIDGNVASLRSLRSLAILLLPPPAPAPLALLAPRPLALLAPAPLPCSLRPTGVLPPFPPPSPLATLGGWSVGVRGVVARFGCGGGGFASAAGAGGFASAAGGGCVRWHGRLPSGCLQMYMWMFTDVNQMFTDVSQRGTPIGSRPSLPLGITAVFPLTATLYYVSSLGGFAATSADGYPSPSPEKLRMPARPPPTTPLFACSDTRNAVFSNYIRIFAVPNIQTELSMRL